ncbi:uncharacterized protein LOC112589148 [Harpegnathos saltator]|uniref:uncharacterized protein LOC112589148 n=1 Tax=Harpegnathos saltator TaxID=610380 RepID=UPI000DBEE5F4|nr:uncharacterized protein LOC112589148 [Harpegnathos saltator]
MHIPFSSRVYTSEYYQRRCTSLREQYNREKEKMENECKSGSAAPNPKSKFSLYSKLKFLDEVIKRRRTYSNVPKWQSNSTLIDKSVSRNKACISDNVDTSSSNKEN